MEMFCCDCLLNKGMISLVLGRRVEQGTVAATRRAHSELLRSLAHDVIRLQATVVLDERGTI